MWTCSQCNESVDEGLTVCWKCGTREDGVTDPAFRSVAPEPEPVERVERGESIVCARCRTALRYVGRRRFHEGTNWGFLGEVGELFVKKEHFDVYLCPRCGQVEFFVDGIGEEHRPH
jgi:hypothetical protein